MTTDVKTVSKQFISGSLIADFIDTSNKSVNIILYFFAYGMIILDFDIPIIYIKECSYNILGKCDLHVTIILQPSSLNTLYFNLPNTNHLPQIH
jgi:hypothetical protein